MFFESLTSKVFQGSHLVFLNFWVICCIGLGPLHETFPAVSSSFSDVFGVCRVMLYTLSRRKLGSLSVSQANPMGGISPTRRLRYRDLLQMSCESLCLVQGLSLRR